MAEFGMRVKSRSGKRDFKYKREQDNVFFRDGDAGIMRYSMAGYGITVPCTKENCLRGGGGGGVNLTGDAGHSVGDADDGDEYEPSSIAEEEEFQLEETQTLSTLNNEANFLLGRESTFGRAVRFNHWLMFK